MPSGCSPGSRRTDRAGDNGDANVRSHIARSRCRLHSGAGAAGDRLQVLPVGAEGLPAGAFAAGLRQRIRDVHEALPEKLAKAIMAETVAVDQSTKSGHGISFGEAVRVWAKVAALSF